MVFDASESAFALNRFKSVNFDVKINKNKFHLRKAYKIQLKADKNCCDSFERYVSCVDVIINLLGAIKASDWTHVT